MKSCNIFIVVLLILSLSVKSFSGSGESISPIGTLTSLKTITITSAVAQQNWQVGTTQTITWSITYIENIKIELSTDNGNNWVSITDSVPANPGTFQWTVADIPSTQCKLKLSDIKNSNNHTINSGSFTIFKYITTIPVATTLYFNDVKNTNNYKMFSLPGQNSKPIAELFTGNHQTDWNAFWDNGQDASWKKEYDGTAAFTLTPGKAFWVLSSDAINVNTNVNTVPLNPDATYEISLHNGWNIIGNPFEKNVLWADVKSKNNLLANQLLNYWNGAQYQSESSFETYKGYYFNNSQNLAKLKIPYPAGSTANKISSGDMIVYPTEKVDISLITNSQEIKVTAGFDENAAEGFDEMDYYNAPLQDANSSLSLYNADFPNRTKSLFVESRPQPEQGSDFRLIVSNNNSTDAKLIFRISENLKEKSVYLADKEYFEFINIGEKRERQIPAYTKSKEYSLLIGTADYIASKKAELTPTDFELYQNFPNPFNPTTRIKFALPEASYVTIKLYDILGREIKTLINEEKSAGGYEIEFNAADIASGVYFYRLYAESSGESGTFTSIKKMLLLR